MSPEGNFEEQKSSERAALKKAGRIWSEGNLFHVFKRWAVKKDGQRIDRLPEIFKRGLIPPLLDGESKVTSDIRFEVKGTSQPYHSVVFLHRFDQNISYLYIPHSPESLCVFIDRKFPVLTIEQMGDWPKCSIDEVYSTKIIPPERFIGLAVPDRVAKDIHEEFKGEFYRLGIPLYDLSGKLIWPSKR